MEEQQATCIRLRGVTKEFGTGRTRVRAVSGLNLDINAGEIVALLGPNGAGKTTTLDMILGFTRPTDGTIAVFGVSPVEAVRAGRVSAVLQTGGLLRDLEVGETVELVASLYDDPPAADEVLARAGLGGLADRKVQDCSGGEQQRLRFALALLADPDLLILDEPTAGMDVEARQDFWAAMRAEAADGRTIVFATHYLQEAEDFAHRTVLLADGGIAADGPTAVLRRNGGSRRLRARFALDRIGGVAALLERHRSVGSVHIDGDCLVVETRSTTVASGESASDDLARLILGELAGRDLEIESASLERAFVELIGHTPPSEPIPARSSS